MPDKDGDWVRAEVERIHEEMPAGLVEWADDQDVKLSRRRRIYNWGNFSKKLRRWGMMQAAKCYVGEQTMALIRKYKVTNRRTVARQIVYDFLEDRLLRSADVCRLWGERANEDPDSHLLPAAHCWVLNHPGLSLDDATLADPVAKCFVDVYQRDVPPPNQWATNLYMMARQDPKMMAKVFADGHAAILAERRKIKEAAKADDPVEADSRCWEKEYEELLGGGDEQS